MRGAATIGAALLLAQAAWAVHEQEVGDARREEQQKETAGEAHAEVQGKKFPLSATVIYDNSLGAGTFYMLANPYVANPAWSMSLSMRPALTLDKVRVSMRLDVQKNLLVSYVGNANADASAESYMRQTTVSDLMLVVQVPELYKEPVTGVTLGAGITGYAPISMMSRGTNQVFAVRPHLTLSWSWEGLGVSYAFYFKKNFHTTTNPTYNLANLPNSLQFRPGGAEDLGDGEIAVGTVRNTSHLVYNYFELSYSFLEHFTAAASLFVINAFKYTLPLSEQYSSEYAKASGQVDSTWGTLELSYKPFEKLGFALGISSFQPAFTADNKRFRFPFFDFVSTSQNYTSVYFDVIGTL